MKYKSFKTVDMVKVTIFAEKVVYLANGEMDNHFVTGFCAVSANFAAG